MEEDLVMTDATDAFDTFNAAKSKGKAVEHNNATDDTLPWVEKYRPVTLDDLVSHKDITSTIERFIDENRLPHMLLYGPPGTGKTSTILACARKLYGPMWKSMTMELNASDDRGIDVVREQIKNFASTKKIFSSGFKLIILDEADMMTQTAQNALRRVVEKYTRNVRFCIICNYVSKIIPALQSRCTRFRFGPLELSQVDSRLDHIIQNEGVKITDEGRKALLQLSKGDMRRALNILQACHAGYEIVDEDAVYNCTGNPHPADIETIVNSMLTEDFTTAYSNISYLKTIKGMALQDILTEVYNYLELIDMPSNARVYVLDKMADVEYKLSTGANEKLQLTSLIGSFRIGAELMQKLMMSDLSGLLVASGLPLSGTKSILVDRLVTHLASIMDRVDYLEPQFFRHNNNNINNTNSHTSNTTSSASSSSLPHSSFFSPTLSATFTDTIPHPTLHNHYQIDAEMMNKIKDRILPRSIVSIDIGIRNLAWVELSKDGKILRWAIEDLLAPSSSDGPQGVTNQEHAATPVGSDTSIDATIPSPSEIASLNNKKTTTRRRTGSNSSKRVKKPPAPSYDPRSVALRVDQVMRTILLESDSVQGIILERQRFRTGGMHAMLDVTFKCGVVEGMIHTWFAFWQRERQHERERAGRVDGGGSDGGGGEKDKEEPSVFIESVTPRAVAVRWGIGASGAKASSQRKKVLPGAAGSTITDGDDTLPELVEEQEPVQSADDVVLSPVQQLPKTPAYRNKKFQSRTIVDNWIYDTSDGSGSIVPEANKFRVRCSPKMREWYSQEQKRDDLSDCLLQAVAWFEWKGRAVQEAVERSRPCGGESRSGDGGGDGDGEGEVPKKRHSSKRTPP
ncbi:hypothetical protein BGX29_009923 [Mortierella sp. GBA35]|nr:hypothetical protein BGX29_009923 [Mortierella sp. GBA35]